MIKKILLVDEDPDNLDLLAEALEADGFTVLKSEKSEEGLKLFREQKPDAVAVDLMMERYDSGFVFAYHVKKDPHGQKIPVAILTSATYHTGIKFNASTPEEKEWLKCDFMMDKPIDPKELVRKFEQFYELQEA